MAIATAFAISVVWCFWAVRVGPVLGFVDQPDNPTLKVHQRAAVPLGGVGIFLGVWSGWWVAGALETSVLIPASGVMLLGLVDDRIGLPAWLRLGAQLAMALAAVAARAIAVEVDPLEAIVVVALIVVSINAVNLFDGLDGLAGSTALVTSVGIAALASIRSADPILGLVLAGALIGFLVYNRHPARVFLGDNGAYLVGFLLAITMVRASTPALVNALPLTTLALGVFLLDLSVTILRRALGRRPLFVGDRSHIYDQLIGKGWSVGRVVLGAVILQLGFVALVLLLELARLG